MTKQIKLKGRIMPNKKAKKKNGTAGSPQPTSRSIVSEEDRVYIPAGFYLTRKGVAKSQGIARVTAVYRQKHAKHRLKPAFVFGSAKQPEFFLYREEDVLGYTPLPRGRPFREGEVSPALMKRRKYRERVRAKSQLALDALNGGGQYENHD